MIIFKFKIELILIDLTQIFPMKSLEFEIFLSVKKLPKWLRYRKTQSFETICDIDPTFLITQIDDLNQDCVKISRLYLLYFPRTNPL